MYLFSKPTGDLGESRGPDGPQERRGMRYFFFRNKYNPRTSGKGSARARYNLILLQVVVAFSRLREACMHLHLPASKLQTSPWSARSSRLAENVAVSSAFFYFRIDRCRAPALVLWDVRRSIRIRGLFCVTRRDNTRGAARARHKSGRTGMVGQQKHAPRVTRA